MFTKTLISFFFSAILFIIGPYAYSQTIIPRFESLGVNDGLPHSSVYSITQDKKGFMWFGTPDGLCRYDGSELRVFKYNAEDSGDIINNFIRGKLLEDKAGNIWYSNESGIYFWDAIKEKIIRKKEFLKNEFGNVAFSSVALDSNGSLWLFNVLDGIFEYNIFSGKLTQFPFPGNKNISAIQLAYNTVDEDGNIWMRIVTKNEPYLVFNRSSHNYAVQFEANPPHAVFFSDHKMVSDFNDKLIYTNLQTGESNTISKTINNKKISFYSIEGVKDKYGRLWITTRGKGLYYYDEKNDLFMEFHHDNSKIKSLPFNLTTCLFIDRSENLWVGIDGGGVARLDLKQPKFNLFPLSEGDYSILNDYFTKCFYEDEKERIWFGSHTNGLNIFDTKTDKLANYHSGINKTNSLPGNIVGSILKDANGNMWIGSSGGISLFDEKKNLFKTVVLHGVSQLQPDINSFVYKMIQLNNGDILVATALGLIKIVKQKNDTYEGYYFCDNPFLKSTATDVIEMPGGIIYAALPGNGLYKLTNTSAGYKLSNIFLTGIDLRSIRIDEKDPEWLWVSSGIGLIYFNTITNKYKIWNTNNGLANSYVYGSLEDEKNNLWISTNGGLSYLDRVTNHVENYSYQDGLQSNEFNTQAFYKSPTNTFYFGGIKGFNWFRSKNFKNEQHKPQVAFTQMEVDNILFSMDSALAVNDHIDLPYDKNNLNFKFAALDFTRPEANRIQYTLEGWDTKWITTYTKSVRYSHLPPGNYTMIIKASNTGGIWSDEKRIKFTIEKPYWQTNWFYFLVIFLFIVSIVFATYAFAQMRVRKKLRKLEKLAAIEEERNRISKDMHDEIGNGLTHIALLSELIHAQHSPDSDIKKDINSISTSARKLVQTMSEIIWALNPQNDTLDNLLAYIREQSHQYFEGMNVAFNIHFPEVLPEIKLTNEQRRNLFLVTKEALSNAMKHSQAETIDLSLEITKDKYCFTVTDNGVGMPAQKNKVGSNGVKNMKKRMEDIGGSIEWKNEMKGTSVEYCVTF